jgi:hypothetical protein
MIDETKAPAPHELVTGADDLEYTPVEEKLVDVARLKLLQEVAQKAKEVRTAQKLYFRTRDARTLYDSKNLEKELDALLAKLSDPPVAQKTLI